MSLLIDRDNFPDFIGYCCAVVPHEIKGVTKFYSENYLKLMYLLG